MQKIAAVLVWTFAASGWASYPGNDLWLPVAGRAAGAGGREFHTRLSISNLSDQRANVAFSFYPSGQPGGSPRNLAIRIPANTTHTQELGPELVTPDRPVGSLRIRSRELLSVTAFVFAVPSMVGGVLNAIPAELAIGSGEGSMLHGSTNAAQSKLYVAETHGFPLYFSVTLTGVDGEITGRRRLYVGPYEQRAFVLSERFKALQVRGINGSGRIVIAGSGIEKESDDSNFYEMSLPTRARHRLRWGEWLAYTLAGAALAMAGLSRRKS